MKARDLTTTKGSNMIPIEATIRTGDIIPEAEVTQEGNNMATMIGRRDMTAEVTNLLIKGLLSQAAQVLLRI